MAPRRERTTTASFTVEETCDALRRWFRGLSPLERLQALAIQDAVWVKMYMVLAHKKPMQGMAEKEFEKELVKAIFHKLRKQSDDNHLLDSVLLSPSPSDASTETMELPSSRIITSRPSTMFCELQGSIRLLCGSLKHSSSNVNSSDQCKGGHEASHGGEHDHLEPIVEASNELQETVRLCDIRSTMSGIYTSFGVLSLLIGRGKELPFTSPATVPCDIFTDQNQTTLFQKEPATLIPLLCLRKC